MPILYSSTFWTILFLKYYFLNKLSNIWQSKYKMGMRKQKLLEDTVDENSIQWVDFKQKM